MIGRAASGRTSTWKPRPAPEPAPLAEAVATFRDRVAEILEPVFALVARIVRIARWVLERVAVLYPVRWYAWQTAADERTCPECGALHGQTWREDRPAPAPPLHVNCRCQVVLARTEWRVRYVPTWRLRTVTRQEWEWKRTT